jgi:hypothetical protein
MGKRLTHFEAGLSLPESGETRSIVGDEVIPVILTEWN